MSYAGTLRCSDADSHVMDYSDWIRGYADASIRARLRDIDINFSGDMAAPAAQSLGSVPDADERTIMRTRGWAAAGASDPADRAHALDLLGFERQLVFSSFSPRQFMFDEDEDVQYGGALALNRAICDFCSQDKRLLPVGWLPLDNPGRALRLAAESIKLGCTALQVHSYPAALSPAHASLRPVWSVLAGAGCPFMLHIEPGGQHLMPATYYTTGLKDERDADGLTSLDYMSIYHPPEQFLAAMVLDGVFDEFPGLRCGCIEQGAMWVVPFLRRLDLVHRQFSMFEPALRELKLSAADYIRRQVKITPFPGEPVAWLIEQAGPELFLFSTDYPHPEGSRDPISNFEATMEGVRPDDRDRFYLRNFDELLSGA
jgi:uncharacterized protein